MFRYFPSSLGSLDMGASMTNSRKRKQGSGRGHLLQFLQLSVLSIVWQRLESLQKQMDFTLEKIDVTLKPKSDKQGISRYR